MSVGRDQWGVISEQGSVSRDQWAEDWRKRLVVRSWETEDGSGGVILTSVIHNIVEMRLGIE